MLTHPLLHLRQGDLDRLRPARRGGARAVLGRRTLHLRGLESAAARIIGPVTSRDLSGDNQIVAITEKRAAALASLTAAAAGDSLCTIDRERLPAAKFHEGAVAALGDALRAARAGRHMPHPTAWGSQWDARAASDPAWRAYLLGGRDALAGLSTVSPA